MALPIDPNIANPTGIPDFDGFNSAAFDTFRWGSKVEDGSTTITVTSSSLKITNTGAGTAGISYLPTAFTLGKIWRTSTDLRIETFAGDHGEISLVLYKDGDNYVKFGPYKTNGGTNDNAHLRATITGVAQPAQSLASTVIDTANAHTYTLAVLNNLVLVFYDGEYKTSFAFPELIDYQIQIEGGTWSNTDTIAAWCDDFETINNFDPLQMTIGLMCDEIGTMVTDIYSRMPGVEADLDNILTAISGISFPGVEADLDHIITDVHGVQTDLTNVHLDVDHIGTDVDNIHADVDHLGADTDSIITILGAGIGSTTTPFSGTLNIPDTNPVALEFTQATYGDRFHINLMADLGGNDVDYCWIYDAATLTYTNQTADCNSLQTNSIYVAGPTGPTQWDGLFIGGDSRFHGLDFYIEDGVPNRSLTITWQGYMGGSWTNLTVTDGSSYGGKTCGKSGRITWTEDIEQVEVNGVTKYWVLAVVTGAVPAGAAIPMASHIQVIPDSGTGFDSRAPFLGTLYAKIYRKIGGAYSALPSDIMPFTQCILDRNVDIGSFECWSDTKVVFSLSESPSAAVAIPYAGYVLQL